MRGEKVTWPSVRLAGLAHLSPLTCRHPIRRCEAMYRPSVSSPLNPHRQGTQSRWPGAPCSPSRARSTSTFSPLACEVMYIAALDAHHSSPGQCSNAMECDDQLVADAEPAVELEGGADDGGDGDASVASSVLSTSLANLSCAQATSGSTVAFSIFEDGASSSEEGAPPCANVLEEIVGSVPRSGGQPELGFQPSVAATCASAPAKSHPPALVENSGGRGRQSSRGRSKSRRGLGELEEEPEGGGGGGGGSDGSNGSDGSDGSCSDSSSSDGGGEGSSFRRRCRSRARSRSPSSTSLAGACQVKLPRI